jgi:hypothetical protein
MHINPRSKRFRSTLSALFAVMAILAGYSSKADAQFTYSGVTTGAGLIIETSNGGAGTSYTATPVMTGTATDGTDTATGSFSGVYGNGEGSFSGTGSANVTYNFDPTGLVVNIDLNGTANAVTANGGDLDNISTDPSGGVGSGTDFMVATTGEYDLAGLVTFGGRESAQGGALFVTYTVNDDTNSGGLQTDNDLEDENPTPDVPLDFSELVTLTAGDVYTLGFGAEVNPGSASNSAPASSTLTGSAEASITEVPEPSSLSLLSLMAISLAARGRRRAA